jgi:hypothetical protein
LDVSVLERHALLREIRAWPAASALGVVTIVNREEARTGLETVRVRENG